MSADASPDLNQLVASMAQSTVERLMNESEDAEDFARRVSSLVETLTAAKTSIDQFNV